MKKQLPIVWEPMNCLYVHINKTNGKKYFGITSQKPRQRWNKGKGYTKNQIAFYNAIQKYGWDGFYHIVIFQNLDRFMACELEKYFIDKYKTTQDKCGYNITTGGDSPKMAESTKQKLREASTNKKEIICLETLQIYESLAETSRRLEIDMSAIRLCCLNNTNNFTCKGLHFMFLEDYLNSDCKEIEDRLNKKKTPFSRPVICLETNKIYNSSQEVHDVLNCSITVLDCCKGKTNSAGGYHWLFLDDYKNKSKEEIQSILATPIGNQRNNKKVICLDTNTVFKSIAEASEKMRLPRTQIGAVCNMNNKSKTVNGYHFLYFEYYKTLSKTEVENILKIKPGRIRQEVVCLTNNVIYQNVNQASKLLGLNGQMIYDRCNSKDYNRPVKGYCFQYLKDFKGNKENLTIEKQLNYPKRRKAQKVVCLNTLTVYPSILQAYKQTGCNQNEILKCCNHQIKSTKGISWLYEEEYKKEYRND